MDMNVKVSTNPIVCYETDTIGMVAEKMKEYEIGFLPVVNKEKKVVGVITDRDLVIRAIANKEKKNCQVKDYMTKHVCAIDKKKSIKEALEMMKKETVTRLLVTDEKKLVGIVSLFDFLKEDQAKSIFETLKNMKKKETLIQLEPQVDEFYL